MPSRSIAFCICITIGMFDGATGITEAGGLFRSRTQPRSSGSPSQSYRQRGFGARDDAAEKKKPESSYDSMFDGVEKPPAAPRPEAGGGSTAIQLPRLTGRPSDTQQMVDEAIERTKKRYLTVGEHTPWQIFHGVLALRHEFQLRHENKLVRGLDWLRDGVSHDGLPLVEKTEHGARCHPFTVPWAFEGHVNQFLAILSLSSLPREYQFRTPSGEIVSMGDMVDHAQKAMTGRGEMTWTLWFLTHYVEPDAEWETAAGQYWSMERLVRMEARNKINGAPCGGTHRLFALSLARNAYLAKSGRLSGAWIEADQQVRKHVAIARSVQNRDGSFSSDWFKGRGYSTDLTTRLKTSGHILEWLMVAMSEKELDQQWVQLAIQSVARDVIRSSREPAECGALYHALDALTFYQQRRMPKPAAERSPTLLVPETPKPQAVAAADDAPSEFVEPQAMQPIRDSQAGETKTIPRVAALPDVGLRPLAGLEPDRLVVESVEPPAAHAEPISPELAPNPLDSEPSELLVEDVPVASLAESETSDAVGDDMTQAISPPEAEEGGASESTVAAEETLEVTEIPADALPLETVIPDQPDGESNPLGEDGVTVEVQPDELGVEDVEVTTVPGGEEDRVPAAMPAVLPDVAVPDTVVEEGVAPAATAADDGVSPAAEPNEEMATEEPEADESSTDGADTDETDENATSEPNEIVVETEEPLAAPARPADAAGVTAEADPASDGTARLMRSAQSPLGGLILLRLPISEEQPITVPVVGIGEAVIQRTSWGWRESTRSRAR